MTCILKEIMIVFVELESVSLSDHLSFFFLALGRLVHHCVLFGARERKKTISLSPWRFHQSLRRFFDWLDLSIE